MQNKLNNPLNPADLRKQNRGYGLGGWLATGNQFPTTQQGATVVVQYNGGGVALTNTTSPKTYVVTTAGAGAASAYVLGSLLLDNGSGVGPVMVYPPTAGVVILTRGVFVAGTFTLLTATTYVWTGSAWSTANLPTTPGKFTPFRTMQKTFDTAVMCTVTFDINTTLEVTSNAGVLPASVAALARVNFLINGVNVQRIFDVMGGESISNLAEAVTITLEDNSQGAPAGIPYQVTVLIAPYPRPGSPNMPTLTPNPSPTPIAPASVSTPQVVPQASGAKSAMVNIAPTVAGAPVQAVATAMYSNFAGDLLPLKQWSLSAIAQFIPLPPGAQYLEVKNLDPTNPITFSVTFGIDG